MNIAIQMKEPDPVDVRANGPVRERGNRDNLVPDVTVRRGASTKFTLGTGKYTYVFGINRKASFKLVAINADTQQEISDVTPYNNATSSEELRYFFEVP